MISLFATGDFIRVRVTEDHYEIGRECLLMGFFAKTHEDVTHLFGIVNGQDGQIAFVDANDLVSDFVYDVDKDRFVDAHALDVSGDDEVPMA